MAENVRDTSQSRKPLRSDGLTDRQREVLGFIASLSLPPTLREIGKHFGWSSTNAIACHLAALAKKGMLVRLGTGAVVGSVARGIELTPAGREAAGLAPAPKSDADLDTLASAWAKLTIGQRRDVAAYARRLGAS